MGYAEHFSIANLPYGIASHESHPEPAVVTRIGDSVIFLSDLDLDCSESLRETFKQSTLNALAARDKGELLALRRRLRDALGDASSSVVVAAQHGKAAGAVRMHLPVAVGGFTDYSCSREHGLNASEAILGRRLSPPAFERFPIGYGGRASSIVVSGTPVRRPRGVYYRRRSSSPPRQDRGGGGGGDGDGDGDGGEVGEGEGEGEVVYGATRALDYELEMACVVGRPSVLGESVALEDADEHIFGIVLINDWSARDIQGFEMQPLGPMNGKSFGTTMSPWVVPLEALEPFACAAPAKAVPAIGPLRETREKAGFDIQLRAELLSTTDGGEGPRDPDSEPRVAATEICRSNVAWMYWTFRDLVAQQTLNGCDLRTGDVLATGTVSGAGAGQHGCLLELTRGGRDEFALADGQRRTYLRDGDGVRLTAVAGEGVGFGECTGFVTGALAV